MPKFSDAPLFALRVAKLSQSGYEQDEDLCRVRVFDVICLWAWVKFVSREQACCSQSGTDASMDVGSRAKRQAPVASRGSLRAPESLNGAKAFTSRKPLALLGALKSHTLVCRICSNY